MEPPKLRHCPKFLGLAGAAPLTGRQRTAGVRRAARARLIAQGVWSDQETTKQSERRENQVKQIQVVEELDAILGHVPTEQQIHVALRYGGVGEVIQKMSGVREKLEALKAKLAEKLQA
jgi:hypothetical protein